MARKIENPAKTQNTYYKILGIICLTITVCYNKINIVTMRVVDMENLMTTQELMDYLKISRTTIDRWRKEGMPYLSLSKAIRFEREEVLKWIKESKSEK